MTDAETGRIVSDLRAFCVRNGFTARIDIGHPSAHKLVWCFIARSHMPYYQWEGVGGTVYQAVRDALDQARREVENV